MSIKNSLQKKPNDNLNGHERTDPARYAPATRHMVIFEVLSENFPMAGSGERVRLYLSDKGYQNITARTERGEIKIIRYARIRRGEIIPDAPERDEIY